MCFRKIKYESLSREKHEKASGHKDSGSGEFAVGSQTSDAR